MKSNLEITLHLSAVVRLGPRHVGSTTGNGHLQATRSGPKSADFVAKVG
jgi:hypothetical protein